MAVDRLDDVDAGGGGYEVGELVLEAQRVEAVRRDAGDRRPARSTRASAAATPPRPRPTSWWFIASRQHDVGVRVEAPRQLLAVVLEVRLDRVATALERVLVALVAAAEALSNSSSDR